MNSQQYNVDRGYNLQSIYTESCRRPFHYSFILILNTKHAHKRFFVCPNLSTTIGRSVGVSSSTCSSQIHHQHRHQSRFRASSSSSAERWRRRRRSTPADQNNVRRTIIIVIGFGFHSMPFLPLNEPEKIDDTPCNCMCEFATGRKGQLGTIATISIRPLCENYLPSLFVESYIIDFTHLHAGLSPAELQLCVLKLLKARARNPTQSQG